MSVRKGKKSLFLKSTIPAKLFEYNLLLTIGIRKKWGTWCGGSQMQRSVLVERRILPVQNTYYRTIPARDTRHFSSGKEVACCKIVPRPYLRVHAFEYPDSQVRMGQGQLRYDTATPKIFFFNVYSINIVNSRAESVTGSAQ